MRVIIAGSRSITDIKHVLIAVATAPSSLHPITEVVSGGAEGIDRLGMAWAWSQCPLIPTHEMPANWLKYGVAAGPERNTRMAGYADALIAVWDGKSKGTRDMITKMQRLGKPVHVHKVLSDQPLPPPIKYRGL